MAVLRTSESRAASFGAFSKLPSSFFDLAVSSLFLNILSLALPLSLLQVYDRIVPNTSEGTLFLLVSGVAVAVVLEGVLRVARSAVTGWVGARFEHLAGCAAVERLLTSDLKEFERDGSGVHLERLNALPIVKEFYAGQAILTVLDLPFLVLYLTLVAFLGGSLVFVPITVLVAFVGSAGLLGTRLRGALKERLLSDERRFSFVIEVLGGIHTVKSMAMEAQMLRRYERLQETSARNNFTVTLSNATALTLGAFFSQISVIAVVALGSTYVIGGSLTVGGLAACTMLSGRAMQPLMRAIGVWTRLQTIRLAGERLQHIFAMRPEAPAGLPAMPPIDGAVRLSGVSLQYDPKAPPVLEKVDLDIAVGACIGIVGGNSSGKSSLVSIMAGVVNPTEGTILFDDHDLRDYDRTSFKRQVAYLPQNAELFQGTLLENLTLFDPMMRDEALRLARTLGLDDVIASMPLGYDTRVGDSALDAMPRGIKQRIAIARALLYGPRLVLFDEANTAIDRHGDDILREALESMKGRVTLVLVTHRPSLLKLADTVYEIADGRLRRREPRPAPAAGGAAGGRPGVSGPSAGEQVLPAVPA